MKKLRQKLAETPLPDDVKDGIENMMLMYWEEDTGGRRGDISFAEWFDTHEHEAEAAIEYYSEN